MMRNHGLRQVLNARHANASRRFLQRVDDDGVVAIMHKFSSKEVALISIEEEKRSGGSVD